LPPGSSRNGGNIFFFGKKIGGFVLLAHKTVGRSDPPQKAQRERESVAEVSHPKKPSNPAIKKNKHRTDE
jgi:hypothetical protein